VDKLLLISSSEVGQRAVQHRNVINAAKAAGVKFIAYTSLLHADTSPLGLAAEHIETEQMLADSGIAYALLRNGWYTENYLASAPPALEQGPDEALRSLLRRQRWNVSAVARELGVSRPTVYRRMRVLGIEPPV